MPRNELLPGVSTSACPPRVVYDAHTAIRRARRRAFVRDGMQLSLLVAVDWMFVHWSESRIPFLDRGQSLTFLRTMNAFLFGHIWLSRTMPKWWAKRIASTWCRSEQKRFDRSGGAAGS
jgi:hypothetical protein